MSSAENPPTRPGEPRRSQLRRILEEQPKERKRLGRAIASLGLTLLVTIVAIAILLIWHLRRRGRLVRERLSDPKMIEDLETP